MNPAGQAGRGPGPERNSAEGGGGAGDLLKILRVRDGLAVTVGIVIGVGILRTPGLIAGYLGSPIAMLALWIFGGFVVVLSTLVLAEMAAALPQAGGKYVYAREAYGPQIGFVVGWSELLVTRGFSGAAKAVVIAEYLVLLLGRRSVPLLAGTAVLAFFFLHTGGLKVALFLAIGTAGVLGSVPLYPLLPGITVLLYFPVLVTNVWTQPGLGIGAGIMLGTLWLAGILTLRTSK